MFAERRWLYSDCSGLEDHGLSDYNNFAASFGLAEVVPLHKGFGGFLFSGSDLVDGSRLLVLLRRRRFAGLLPTPWVGVFGMLRRARYWSSSHYDVLRNIFLAVFTADLTLPFFLLWCSDVVVCSMAHFFVKDLNSLNVSYGPLSVTNCLGIP